NTAGEVVVTPGSDPAAAARAAAASWNAIADSRVNFARFDQGSRAPGLDSVNLITFRDSPETRSLVGEATAVTSYFVLRSSNTIIESDIVFNPNLRDEDGRLLPFASTGEPGAFDIE